MKFDANKDFSFGFEIEGIFHKNLIKKLNDKFENDLKIKSDGSVYYNEILAKYNLYSTHELSDADETEINLGIFKTQSELINNLKLFVDGKNYFQNDRCGLHIHVYPKKTLAREMFWNYKFIKKLQTYAFCELCNCTKRRKEVRFCKPYTDFQNTLYEYHTGEKYRFVRNHPLKTWEFRFFSPCEHKVENVKKFLNFLMKELTLSQNKQHSIITLNDNSDKISSPNYFLDNKQKKIYRINYSI